MNSKIRCTRCDEILKKVVWLELSITDGKYYNELPNDHESQGGFPFGTSCAKTQLKEDNEKGKR